MKFRKVEREDLRVGLKLAFEDLLKNGSCDDKDTITIVQIDHDEGKLYFDTGNWDYIDTTVACYMIVEDKSKFEELRRKIKDQVFCGIASGRITDDWVEFSFGDTIYIGWHNDNDELIDELIDKLDKNWEEKHATANRNAEPKPIFEYRDEVDQLIESRSNGTYDNISDTASRIIEALGVDSKYTYFFSQIANKLARIKNDYSVEDSLLDIAGYAKLELEKERKNER